MFAKQVLYRSIPRVFMRNFSEGVGPISSTTESSSTKINNNVPGLSSAVILPANNEVGPGVDPKKSGAYKSPEYYCYNRTSYYEAEVEMAKYRLPQPSSLKK